MLYYGFALLLLYFVRWGSYRAYFQIISSAQDIFVNKNGALRRQTFVISTEVKAKNWCFGLILSEWKVSSAVTLHVFFCDIQVPLSSVNGMDVESVKGSMVRNIFCRGYRSELHAGGYLSPSLYFYLLHTHGP